MIGFGSAAGPVPWILISDVLPDSGVSISVTHLWMWTAVFG